MDDARDPQPPAPLRYAIGAGLGLLVGVFLGVAIDAFLSAVLICVAAGLAVAYVLAVLREDS